MNEHTSQPNVTGGSIGRVSITSTPSAEVNFGAQDQYVFQVVQNMVDYVALHDARVNEVKQQHEDTEESKDQAESLEDKVAKIPLNPIPSVSSGSKKDYPEVDLKNEIGADAGRFGWCIVCRNTANVYCRETRHPVCSAECKKKHLIEGQALEGPPSENLPNLNKPDEASLAFIDAQIVFRAIVKLIVGGDSEWSSMNQQIYPYAIRTKIIGLELILAVLEKPKDLFLQKSAFINVIKGTLCDGLLRFSVSQEKQIFQLVVSIFYCLFLHFRKHLKHVIIVFIETIFLKLLDSGNSSFHHKQMILSVFDKISRNTMQLLEIFVNYDCDIAQTDISEQIIESLSKIANGKFTKSEHQSIINAQDEYQLRVYATKILIQMLRSFNATIDAEVAESKISEKMMNSLKQSAQSAMTSNQTDFDMSTGRDSVEQDTDSQFTPASRGTIASSTSNEQKSKIEILQDTRLQKQELNKAATKFNFKAKNGIAYLVQAKMIPSDKDNYQEHIKGIVKFLKGTPSLDKTTIGEFMGVDKEFNKDVLYEFIDSFDLRGLQFVEALKRILQGFRIPGEGQIVDRIMEKFGKKYELENPQGTDEGQGPMSAECLYLLAYATMMMQTSLHNPNAAKSRMTVEDFAKMIKGINDGQNLNQEFIQKIYDTVEKEPFSLNEDDDARMKQEAAGATTFKRKQELFQKEGQGLVERGKNQIKVGSSDQFITVDECSPIKPMFENTWSANLGTFSVILEETNDEAVAALCIEGFVLSIKICGYFEMKTERDAFVSSLAKFTSVTNERKIKPKNITCIMKLLELAKEQGNYLGDSWYFILDCVSKLEEMISRGSGQMQDRDFFDHSNAQPVVPKQRGHSSSTAAQKAAREAILQYNSELIAQHISEAQIDVIFQSSINLNQMAVIAFIENLCKVSQQELNDQTNPRKFSLQCMVMVADLNMARIRFVWQKIWQRMSEHFTQVGSHPNLMVAMFAIDSLRQLADKFLEREEYKSFNFQKDFLKPFEQIMLNNLHTRSEIKEFIVMCITNLSGMKTAFIKSGWSVIINIFTLAAQDTEEQLVKSSFTAIKQAVMNHFDLLEEGFVELINCLNKYSQNQAFPQQSKDAQELLLVCTEKLAKSESLLNFFIGKQGNYLYQRDQENMSQYPPQYGIAANREKEDKPQVAGDVPRKNSQQPTEDAIRQSVLKGLWFPILTNLTNLALEKNVEKQQSALDTLFKVLQASIKVFNLSLWREVLSQVLFPLLEDIHLAIETPGRRQDDKECQFYQYTIQAFIQKFNLLFVDNFDLLQDVIPSYFDILCLFISKTESKRIAQSMITNYSDFIQDVGTKLSPEQWDSFTLSLSLCFEETLPRQLLDETIEYKKQQDGSVDEELDKQFAKCLVQLFLVNTVKDTLSKFYDSFSVQNIKVLLDCLNVSNKFAKDFNSQFDLRLKLWKVGFMADLQQLPGLIAQEYRSLATILLIEFMMYFTPKEGSEGQDISELFELCSRVLKDYVLKQSELIAINSSKLQKKEDTQSEGSSQEDKDQSSLHETELERQLANLTPIVSHHILGNFAKLSNQDLEKHLKELGPILIELTLCNDYQIRVNNKELLSKMFELMLVKF